MSDTNVEFVDDAIGWKDADSIGDTVITLYASGDRMKQAEFLRRLADVLEKETQ